MMRFAAGGFWYLGQPVEEKIRRVAAAGFKALEDLAWVNNDPDSVKAALDECGVSLTAVVLQSRDTEINAAVGQRHGMVWEDAYEAYEKAFRESLVYMKKVGVPMAILVPGLERQDVSREKQRENIVKTMKNLGSIAEAEGVRLTLEPLNVLVDHKGQYLWKTEEAVSILEEVGSPAISLLYDVYHQQISEGNLISTITKYMDKIGHIHLADVPGRKEPGTGEINYTNVLNAIRDGGYNGTLAFESFCSTDGDDVARRMYELIKPYET